MVIEIPSLNPKDYLIFIVILFRLCTSRPSYSFSILFSFFTPSHFARPAVTCRAAAWGRAGQTVKNGLFSVKLQWWKYFPRRYSFIQTCWSPPNDPYIVFLLLCRDFYNKKYWITPKRGEMHIFNLIYSALQNIHPSTKSRLGGGDFFILTYIFL